MAHSKAKTMKSRIWDLFHHNKTLFRLITTKGTTIRISDIGDARDKFPTNRIYRDSFVWVWRHSYTAMMIMLVILAIIVSIAFNLSELVTRLGAVLIATSLISEVFVGDKALPTPTEAAFKAELASINLSGFKKTLPIALAIIGTIVWAFGDWLTCSIDSRSLSTCSC